jgi:hypothetical protein
MRTELDLRVRGRMSKLGIEGLKHGKFRDKKIHNMFLR